MEEARSTHFRESNGPQRSNRWQPIMVRRDENHLTPGTEAGWFLQTHFLSASWRTLGEKYQGEEKAGLRKVQSNSMR